MHRLSILYLYTYPLILYPILIHLSIHSTPPSSPFNSKNPFLASISLNRELHKSGDRSCMHIEVDITGSKMSYVAGDHLALLPENDVSLVERMGKLLGADLDTVFSLNNVDG